MEERKVINTAVLKRMKEKGEKIAMITAYDYPSALLADQAGADILLVGDSVGNTVLGYESTIPVTMDVMVHHTKAVTRAAKRSFVVSDLPFLSYHSSKQQALLNAGRLLQEGLAKAVKLEGGTEIAETVAACVQAGIPVMGHIGLTPQSVYQLGGYRVQGRHPEQASKLLQDAKALEQAGAFAIVLEMVPESLASEITSELTIPVIGIGAGRYCDGQVLVYHDLLQYASPLKPRFVKTYANIGELIQRGISEYVKDVKTGTFPEEQHVFE